MIKVILLGAGNVATHLYKAFAKVENVTVVQVYNRQLKGLEHFNNQVAITTLLSDLKKADVYIISIADDAIAKFSKTLSLKNELVVHTSGSIAMDNLDDHNKKGVFYPLQSFTKGKDIDFKQIPICIEAYNKKDEILLTQLANSISENVHIINSKQRKSLHLAAVFVNNFVNHLYTIGEDICQKNNVSFDILKPLIQETAKKIIDLSPADSQTGPAKRNDKKVIALQLSELKNKTQQDIYQIITQSITAKYGNKL